MIAITLIALAGCASFEAKMSDWHGRKVNDLIFSWGPPTTVQRMSDGRQIITYSGGHTISGTTYDCKVWFFVDADETIIKSDGEGTLGGCNRFFSGRKSANE